MAFAYGSLLEKIKDAELGLPPETREKLEPYEGNENLTPDELDELSVVVAEIYGHVSENFGISSPEYDNAVYIIEDSLIYPVTKKAAAKAFFNAFEDKAPEDDYLRLMWTRHVYYSGGTDKHKIEAGLDYFLKSDKSFSQHYSDIIFYAMTKTRDFSSFLDNMRITRTEGLLKNIIRTNTGISHMMLRYMENTGWYEKSYSIKYLRIMSSLSRISFAAADKSFDAGTDVGNLLAEEMRLGLFEIYVRVHNKYLIAVLRENVYCEEMTPNLHEHDAFVYFASRALACKDSNDTAGFVRNLRLGLKSDPHMGSVVEVICKRLAKEISQSERSAKERLDMEVARLRALLSDAVASGNSVEARRLLELYLPDEGEDTDDGQPRQVDTP